jgi:predicted DNA-binding transcriptional regulator YafY
MDKDEKTRLERLVAIEERISNQKYPSMRALCQAFSVKPRTIYADIRLLRERFGIDIRFDRFRNGYFNASPGKRIPIGDLVEDDYLLLMIGCALLRSSFGTKMEGTLGSIEASMAKRLPFELSQSIDTEKLFVRSTVSKTAIEPNVFTQLSRALLQKRVVELQIDGGSPYQCLPCCFVEQDDTWFLVGYNVDNASVEKHDLRKIHRCDITNDGADLDCDRLVQHYFASSQ